MITAWTLIAMFKPKYTITPKITHALMRIEAAKQSIMDLPMTSKIQARLRETARLLSTHYSTQIEGNRLTLDEATKVIKKTERFPERKRDEEEVLGYYRALDELEKLSRKKQFKIEEATIQTLHAHVMGGRRVKVKPTPYRDGQNVIRDSRDGKIVYMPPEAKDVKLLMTEMADWINVSQTEDLPCPLRAAIAHYQFATIHPYYDGNGRTARLLATLILYLDGYDLKGFYSLEEYYAKDLSSYYESLAVGPSHNYYMGRAEADITTWIEYFCIGMTESFESVKARAKEAAKSGSKDQSSLLRQLDVRQRKILVLFEKNEKITAPQVGKLLKLQPRTASELCRNWVIAGFLITSDPAKKSRKYILHKKFLRLIFES
jgi:Fic family protein